MRKYTTAGGGQHELAGSQGKPGTLEFPGDLGHEVEVLEAFGGQGDGPLQEGGPRLRHGLDGDVALAERQAQDVGQVVVALLGPLQERHDGQRQAGADGQRGDEGRHSRVPVTGGRRRDRRCG